LPGRGCANWPLILRILEDKGYIGGISIELEDDDFVGSEQLEKKGLIASRDFLANLQ
jgi:sugar phosphate isomerase/epimerase